jgi:hypothetical protein
MSNACGGVFTHPFCKLIAALRPQRFLDSFASTAWVYANSPAIQVSEKKAPHDIPRARVRLEKFGCMLTPKSSTQEILALFGSSVN